MINPISDSDSRSNEVHHKSYRIGASTLCTYLTLKKTAIESSRKLARFLPFFKFFSGWRNREKRKFYELCKQEKFSEAIYFGEASLKKKGNDRILRKRLILAYLSLGRRDLADLKIREGLLKVSGESPDIIVSHIQKEIIKALECLKIESIITDLGGMNNYCQVCHKVADKNSQEKFYITKVITPKGAEREHYFYSQICEIKPKLKSVTPNFIGYFEAEDNRLAFLTLDKISGNEVKLEHIQSVIKAHKLISSFRFNSLKEKFAYSFDESSIMLNFRQKDIRPRVFSVIHHQKTNTLIIKWLHQRISQRNNPLSNKMFIDKLDSIILGKKFYTKIIPSRHFSFLHGDFGPHNLFLNDRNGKVYVIDWAGYFFGPSKFDMVCFLQAFSLNFNDIKQEYIDSILNEDCNDSVIEVSLFIYILITSWFKEKNIDRVLGNPNDYLLPAIDYLEYLTNKLS